MECKLLNGIYTITPGRKFRDHECSVRLGEIKAALRKAERPKKVCVDLSATIWADPLPLLSLGSVLFTVSDYGAEVAINLGSPTTNTDHNIFVKFLAKQGFIKAYCNFATFSWDGKDYLPAQSNDLVSKLSTFQQPTKYLNADCIYAEFIAVNEYRIDPNHIKLHEKVEQLVNDARVQLIDSAYGRDPLVRDRLLQKTRKIIFEILCNVVEHAYPDEYRKEPVKGYAGIYARMRAGLPSNQNEARAWRKLASEERTYCPQISPFDPNPLAPWIEIFICDVGVGLLANVEQWTVSQDQPTIQVVLDELKDDLKNGITRDPLLRLSRILFTQPFSSVKDRTGARTSVTGLLHLGLMLQQDRDFARIYTNGEWAGSRHPWTPHLFRGGTNVLRSPGVEPDHRAPGTWYAFSIQPEQLQVEYPADRWIVASNEDRSRLIASLTLPPLTKIPADLRFEDRRDDVHCMLPQNWISDSGLRAEKVFTITPIVVLRPPRSLQKRQVGLWLDRLSVAAEELTQVNKSGSFIIADLTPFQALTYAELLVRHRLSAASVLDLYLVTEDWAVCCISKLLSVSRVAPSVDLEKARRFIQSDSSDTAPITASAIGLNRLLRHADSIQFWRTTPKNQSLPTDMFLPERVEWLSSWATLETGNTVEGKIYLNGYLDLSRALVDSSRYQACYRALRRCMNLFPEYETVASDDLVHSITLVADRGRHRPRSNMPIDLLKSRKKLIIGSIRATSTTVNRFLNRADVPNESRAIYIFSHPDAPPVSGAPIITVLDWLPPTAMMQKSIDQPIKYVRIPETPYIGVGGEKAIVIPRFRQPAIGSNKLVDSFYERNPQQTYEDFNKMGALKLGHWIYGSSHDLLTINLGRALELSVLENGLLYQWLVHTIEKHCFTTSEDGLRQEPAAVFMYPAHPTTDQIVSALENRHRGQSLQSKDKNSSSLLPEGFIIPLKFLTSNTVSPMRISPLSYDRLGRAIARLRDKTQQPRVVILDDGTLSGKIFRELDQISRGLGANDVHTIALVDRAGLPIYVDYMEQYAEKHHRFWRWDVPPLGRRRGCPLCATLAQVTAMHMHMRLHSSSMSHRLEQWADSWRPVEVVGHWETHGLESTPLGKDAKCDSHRFGIYPNEPEDSIHMVHHRTSTGMVAAIMEITRSTTRSYYALEKAQKMNVLYGPGVGIEILSAQLLLFIDELSYWDRLDVFGSLMRFLWECQEDSDVTALAGLSMMLTDDDILSELWQGLKKDLLCKKKVPILDARIATELLRHRYISLFGEDSDRISQQPTENEIFNYNVMFSNNSFRKNIARILEIIGASYSEIHNMGLDACLKDLKESIQKKEQGLAMRKVKETQDILSDLVDALHMLDIRFWLNHADYRPNPKQDADDLAQLRNAAPKFEISVIEDFFSALGKWADQVKDRVLSEHNRQSFACRYRPQLVKLPNKNEAVSAFWSEAVTLVTYTDWATIIQSRLSNRKPISDRWLNADFTLSNDARPVIESGNREKWQNYANTALYFDRYVKHCHYEIMSNCVHVHEDIVNPWLKHAPGQVAVKATMWWRILAHDQFIETEFVNASDTQEIILGPTEARAGLERVGGQILSFVVETYSGQVTSVSSKCPVPDSRLNELCGLSNGRRAAIVLVRVPKIKTILER